MDAAPSKVVSLSSIEAGTALELTLRVTDPEVISELRRRPAGEERERYAAAALRLGVLSLRMAGGQLDTAAIKEAGQELIAKVHELLTTRASDLTTQFATTLARYFDPGQGSVPQRLEALVKEGGELERLLRSQVGPQDSVLAKALAASLGEGSAIFRLLSPNDAEGLKAQLTRSLEAALSAQREHILREFSLDAKDSALTRLVEELRARQAELGADLKGSVDGVVKEFSLDQPNSALSRLVSKVELAQKQIADQFSSDNETSALNRLSRLLESTREQIGQHLTLDDEQSALFRLKRELTTTLDQLFAKNAEFHAEVRETLAALKTRKEQEARSSLHGAVFEDRLGELLAAEAQHLGDIYEPTGTRTGAIKNCKTGDHVTELGRDTRTPGARIVWEAKEEKGYTLKRALAEVEEARKNRQAQIGVFVFSRKCTSTDLVPLQRHGDDLIVLWDADDPSTDVYVKAAYHCARALTVRQKESDDASGEALQGIELATRAVEKQITFLDEVRTAAETVRSNGERIVKRAEKMRSDLEQEVDRLDRYVAALRAAEPV